MIMWSYLKAKVNGVRPEVPGVLMMDGEDLRLV